MLITSKFDGRCISCGKGISAGEQVSWSKGRKGAEHAACSEEGRTMAVQVAASRAEDSDMVIPAPPGLSYLPYQRAGVAYALERLRRPGGIKGVIIADEMGLGKTIQLIGYLNADPDVGTVLIICPKSLTINWQRELMKWLVIPRIVARVTESHWREASIVIASFEQAKKYQAELEARTWELVGIDEAHKAKNSTRGLTKVEKAKIDELERKAAASGAPVKLKRRATVQRTAAAEALLERGERRMLLTGTPLENRTRELYNLLRFADPRTWDPKGGGKGFFSFGIRYCNGRKEQVSRDRSVWKFDGNSNTAELQTRIRANCMIRRLKADVLKELPPKRRQLIEIEPSAAESKAIAKERAAWGVDSEATAEQYAAAAARMATGEGAGFTELTRLRKVVGVAKVAHVAELVRDLLEGTPKVLIGAWHHEVIDAYAAELADLGFVTITGKHTVEQRQAAVDRFQNDPYCRGLIGQIAAAGVGLTLTAGDTCVVAELPMTPGELSQFEDRLHRIGQTKAVNVYHVAFNGSVDVGMVRMLIAKQETADAVLDNQPAAPEPRELRYVAPLPPDGGADSLINGAKRRALEAGI